MKRYLLFLSITLMSIHCSSQKLTLFDLVQLSEKDSAEISDYLLNKGWEYSLTEVDEKLTTYIMWSFDESETEDVALGWLSLCLSFEYDYIEYRFFDLDIYDEILGSIEYYDLVLTDSGTDEEEYYVYENDSFFLELMIGYDAEFDYDYYYCLLTPK